MINIKIFGHSRARWGICNICLRDRVGSGFSDSGVVAVHVEPLFLGGQFGAQSHFVVVIFYLSQLLGGKVNRLVVVKVLISRSLDIVFGHLPDIIPTR